MSAFMEAVNIFRKTNHFIYRNIDIDYGKMYNYLVNLCTAVP